MFSAEEDKALRKAGAARNGDDDDEPDYEALVNNLDFAGSTDFAEPERSSRESGSSQDPSTSTATVARVTPISASDPSTSHPTNPSSLHAQPGPLGTTSSSTSELTSKYPPGIANAIAKAAATGSPIVLDPLDVFPFTRYKPSNTEEQRQARLESWKNMSWMRKNKEYMDEIRKGFDFEYTLGPPPCVDPDSDEEDDNVEDAPEPTPEPSSPSQDPLSLSNDTSAALDRVEPDANHEIPSRSSTPAPTPPSPVLPVIAPRHSSPSRPSEVLSDIPSDHPCLINPHPIYSFATCTTSREKTFYEPTFTSLRHTGLGPVWGALVSRLFLYEEACGFEVGFPFSYSPLSSL